MSEWDAVAARYDRQLHLETTALRTLLRLGSIGRSDDLLDVGTGTGAVLRTLDAEGTRPRSVVGCDPTAAMLLRVPPLPAGWELRAAEPTRLPADDASADVVTCSYVLHVLDAEIRAALLAEVRRVLRPGGRFVATTVWLPPRLTRGAFALAARTAPTMLGLRPLDPRGDVRAAGLGVRRAAQTRHGYPSLTLLARRAS